MKKIMFVCHGNICRSPVAELLFNDIAKKSKLDFIAYSSETSDEEIYNGVGNLIYPPMRRLLNSDGIDTSKKRAIQLEYSDYNKYDLFIGMDKYNVSNMTRLFKSDKKIKLFHFFDNLNKDVEDPWYTSNFNSVYNEIKATIPYIIDYLKKE